MNKDIKDLVSTNLGLEMHCFPEDAQNFPAGVHAYFDSWQGSQVHTISAILRPTDGNTITIQHGDWAVLLTKTGVSLILFPDAVRMIKNFGPEHTRLVSAWDGEEHWEEAVAESKAAIPSNVVLEEGGENVGP